MATVTILTGGQVTKDPADVKVYVFDFDTNNLADGVMINTSTWTITALSPSKVDTALTKDSEATLTAAQATLVLKKTVALDNRATLVRLLGGTLGQTYEVANKIVTNESPAQTKERSFRVRVENL